MPTVRFRFPGGRYHATPWGHHVNEGLIEWPPSPWRLLRAWLACGFAKLGWQDVSQMPSTARSLVEKLAAVLPFYQLPPATAAHSRHYMPTLEGKAQKTTLVFDAWANVGQGALLIHWPCELDTEEAQLLGQLTAVLSYLGRSESWVEAQLTDEMPSEWNAMPCAQHEHRGPGWEQVSLMAAISPTDYQQWREAQVQEALRPFQSQKQTAPVKKKQAQAIEPYPPDLLSCLTKDTAWWKGHGWSQPPGSRRVLYWRRSDALQISVPVQRRRPGGVTVECMLFAVTSPSGNRSALPPVTRTLPQAELLHRALVARAARGGDTPCSVLTGRDTNGRPLRGHQHAHAHTIPLDLDGDGRLDHILVFARMGLDATAQRAIRALRRTWAKGSADDLQLAVVGSGDRDALRALPPPLGAAVARILGPLAGATVWQSLTPFVPPKTLDRRRTRRLEGQVQMELASRGLPLAHKVELDLALTRKLRHFVRRRGHGGRPPHQDAGYGLRLHFAEPVRGPLLLGYAAHYGLGLFEARES